MATTISISQLADAGGGLTPDALVEIALLSTAVVYTATTLSAQASDNTYNDSAASFITEGFQVGDRVKVEGFTGNVVNNIDAGFVTALAAGKMTIGGADGNVIVDDAAGESVTITKWESYRTTVADIAAGVIGGLLVSNDTTLAGDSATVAPSQHAVITYVAAQVAAIIAAAPGALNTLDELAAALGDDPNFATTVLTLIAAKMPLLLTIETVAGTAYTFASADSAKHKRFTNAAAIAATVPKNSTDAVPVGARIRITVAGAGQLTLTPEDGTVTLNSRGAALKSAGQFAVIEIEKIATNEWDVLGDVTA